MLWKNFEKMAKFYSDKEWLSHSQESRNPWSTSATYLDVGSLGKAILLAEQTGHLPKVMALCLHKFNNAIALKAVCIYYRKEEKIVEMK